MVTKRSSPRGPTDVGMVNRLKDQLKVYKRQQAIHSNQRLLKELAFYPAHDKRMETKEYQQVHKKLAIEQDRPCLICGVRNSTLKNKTQNPYGAKQMETHHHVVEWALANAIDPGHFNRVLLPNLRRQHPQKPEYQKAAFTAEDIAAWVDHSEDNLWVLCDVHHRAKYFGIHEITHPIWGPVDLLREDFEQYVRDEIKKASGGDKSESGKTKTDP